MAPGPRRLPGAFQRRELLPLPGGDARCGCGAASAGTERPGKPLRPAGRLPDGPPWMRRPGGCGSFGAPEAVKARKGAAWSPVRPRAVGRWEAGCPGAFEPLLRSPRPSLGAALVGRVSPGTAPDSAAEAQLCPAGLLRQETGLRRREGKASFSQAEPTCRPCSGGGRWRVGDEINWGLRWLKGEPFGGGGDAARFEWGSSGPQREATALKGWGCLWLQRQLGQGGPPPPPGSAHLGTCSQAAVDDGWQPSRWLSRFSQGPFGTSHCPVGSRAGGPKATPEGYLIGCI